MIRVPDVRVTIAWYQSIGFEVVSTNEDDGEVDWALLSFGDGQVMFNAGGTVSMREFIVRDVNGFWVTFGESSKNP